jgi:hypothetical protein
LLEELGRADVAGMNDVVASRQGVKRLGADQAVGVGDQSDPRGALGVCHRSILCRRRAQNEAELGRS